MTPATVLTLARHQTPPPAALHAASPPPPRSRRSAAERAEWLARFAASGQSAAAFCRAAGLCAVTFSGWRRHHAQRASPAPAPAPAAPHAPAGPVARFAAVRLAALGRRPRTSSPAPAASAAPVAATAAESAHATPLCVVQWPSGLRLVVTAQVAPAWLGAVVAHLR